MKKLYNLLFLIVSHLLFSQNINIPDANFKALLLQSSSANNIAADLNGNSIKIDQNDDGEIQVSEAENISFISLNNRSLNFIYYFFKVFPEVAYPIKDIYSLEGINYFKNLRILDCAFAKISTLDFTNLSRLEILYCNKNQIVSFTNFEFVKSLYALDCSYNLLTNLDLSQSSINVNYEAVLFRFNDNNLQNVNLQNGKKTNWACLCDWSYCPYGSEIGWVFSTCSYNPSLYNNPNLTTLKVNCFELGFYLTEFPFATDNCQNSGTSEIANLNDKIKIFQDLTHETLVIISQLKIKKYTIIDTSGRILRSDESDNKNVDISNLKIGNYIIIIETKEGIVNKKFIKN